MSKGIRSEVFPTNLADHQAVRAWRRLHPDRAALQRVEIVKLKHKTAVFRLSGIGGDGGVVVAKRCKAETAGVERLVYEDLLPAAGVPALQCFGLVPEPAGEFSWLFLEDAGAGVYSPTRAQHRALAARFLAALHCMNHSEALQAALPDRSPNHYFRLIGFSRTALLAQVDNPVLDVHESELLRTCVARCDLMQARWEELERFFEDWPRALVHGDFVIKNLRIRSGERGLELLVFDWEMAGWGVPAVDLAQALGKTATPDLDTYGAALSKCHARVTSGGLARLAAYGSLLRLVDKVYWEALGMQWPAYELLARPLTTLRGYAPQLAAALRAVNWTSHD